ncbi:hypothetical protein NX059_004263 [Plenodomus lindquistii]|nr:hypothetical protein NX059_004263 [Plenodomus lindquistii]
MGSSTPTKTQNSKTWAQKIYKPVGFQKGYNFILWFIFAGGMFGFILARFMFLNFNEHFCPTITGGSGGAAPGECYYYVTFDRYKVGILLHLAGIFVSGLLAILQFTPVIRHRWITFHRICGYFSLLLYVISIVGALMIARHSFGGTLDIQAWIGFTAIATLACFVMAMINIKTLQIEQHRAWMLRAWFYAGSIITSRFIFFSAAAIISRIGGYYTVWPCAKIESTLPSAALFQSQYPGCAAYINGTNPDEVAIVKADYYGRFATGKGAAIGMAFGMALWMATILHAIGVEIYLHLTPKEAQRLRQVSYQKQLEAGMKNPGSAGLTADRLGDTDEWVPDVHRERAIKPSGDLHRKEDIEPLPSRDSNATL